MASANSTVNYNDLSPSLDVYVVEQPATVTTGERTAEPKKDSSASSSFFGVFGGSSASSRNTTSTTKQQNTSSASYTCVWCVTGFENLTSSNKMSSSVFVAGGTHWRLVAMKGIVKKEKLQPESVAANETDDPVGIFVENIVPEGGKAAGATKLSLRVLAVGSGGHVAAARGSQSTEDDVVQSQTHHYPVEDRYAKFQSIILNSMLDINSPFRWFRGGSDSTTKPLPNATLVLELHITFLSKAVVQAASSALSMISRGFANVTKAVAGAFHEVVDERNESPLVGTSGATFGSTEPQHCPWDSTPRKWIGKDNQWHRLLTQTLPENENTFLVGKEDKDFTQNEIALFHQVNLDMEYLLDDNPRGSAATGIGPFEFESDVHEGLLEVQAIRTQRFHLVPSQVTEKRFWANYFWKISLCAKCTTSTQLKLLLSIVNAPPTKPLVGVRTVNSGSEEGHNKTDGARNSTTPTPPVGEPLPSEGGKGGKQHKDPCSPGGTSPPPGASPISVGVPREALARAEEAVRLMCGVLCIEDLGDGVPMMSPSVPTGKANLDRESLTDDLARSARASCIKAQRTLRGSSSARLGPEAELLDKRLSYVLALHDSQLSAVGDDKKPGSSPAMKETAKKHGGDDGECQAPNSTGGDAARSQSPAKKHKSNKGKGSRKLQKERDDDVEKDSTPQPARVDDHESSEPPKCSPSPATAAADQEATSGGQSSSPSGPQSRQPTAAGGETPIQKASADDDDFDSFLDSASPAVAGSGGSNERRKKESDADAGNTPGSSQFAAMPWEEDSDDDL